MSEEQSAVGNQDEPDAAAAPQADGDCSGPGLDPGAAAPATGDEPATPAPAPDPQPETTPEAEAAEAAAAPAKRPPRPKPKFPALMRAFRTKRPVQGTIEKVIKGGYEVRVGKARGFCPHSQIDLNREEDPSRHVGQAYPFRVTQVRRGGEDVVVSRRAILEEEQLEAAKAVRATLLEGAVMQGRVVGSAAFGAFVDLGAGVRGLVHVTELSHSRVGRVDEVVKIGQTVQVRVLKVDDERGRVSLSIRQATEDPWSGIESELVPGSSVSGVVKRFADFGAFVEIKPEVEALAPATEFPPKPGGWREGLEVGQRHDWQVLSVQAKQHRISLALPVEGWESREIAPDAEMPGLVQRVERYGVFVWLGPGRVGLMPRGWSGASADASLERLFVIGAPVDVRVVEIVEDGRRIRLARRGIEARADAGDRERGGPPARGAGAGGRGERRDDRGGRRPSRGRREPREQTGSVTDSSIGEFGTTLADKLRAALSTDDPRRGDRD